jgi:hypothetical protein
MQAVRISGLTLSLTLSQPPKCEDHTPGLSTTSRVIFKTESYALRIRRVCTEYGFAQ